jgi:hypothetical protein
LSYIVKLSEKGVSTLGQENLKKLRKGILLLFYQKTLDIGKFKIEATDDIKKEIYQLENSNEKTVMHSIYYLEDSGYLKHYTIGNTVFAEITIKGIDLVESNEEKINQVFNIYHSHIGTLTGDVYIEKYVNNLLVEYKQEIDNIKQEPNEDNKRKSIKEFALSVLKKSGEMSLDIAAGVLVSYLNKQMGLS